MHPLDDDPHETTERDPGPDRAALRPLRLFQTVTAVTGALSAAGVGGVLALQSRPGYARAVLEARSWGASEVTDADVAAFLTPAGAWPVAAAAVVALTLVLLAGITRRIRAVRPVGSVLVVLGMLTAAFWMVDGGRMVQDGGGGPVVLGAVVGMLVSSAVWLRVAHRREGHPSTTTAARLLEVRRRAAVVVRGIRTGGPGWPASPRRSPWSPGCRGGTRRCS